MLYASADSGYADAHAHIGSLLLHEGNVTKAITSFEKGFDVGSARCATCLGLIHYKGKGVEVNREKAFELFDWAAKGGDALAYYNLGYCMEFGLGTAVNPNGASVAYEKGAILDEPKAMAALGYLLVKRGLEHDRHDEKCRASIEAEYRKGIYWLHCASEHSEPLSFYFLGRVYEQGIGVKSDYIVALENYRKGARSNHGLSALAAGNILYWMEDKSSIKSSNKASFVEIASHYSSAAYSGIPEAMNSLGLLLEDGSGSETATPDPKNAAGWYHMAATKGYNDATLNLALLLSRGSVSEYVLHGGVHFLEDPHRVISNLSDQSVAKSKEITVNLSQALSFMEVFLVENANDMPLTKLSKLRNCVSVIRKMVPTRSPLQKKSTAMNLSGVPEIINSIQRAEPKNDLSPIPVVSKMMSSKDSRSVKSVGGGKTLTPSSAKSVPKGKLNIGSRDVSLDSEVDDENVLPYGINAAPSTGLQAKSTGKRDERKVERAITTEANSGLIPAEVPFPVDIEAPLKNKKKMVIASNRLGSNDDLREELAKVHELTNV